MKSANINSLQLTVKYCKQLSQKKQREEKDSVFEYFDSSDVNVNHEVILFFQNYNLNSAQ